MADGDEDWLPDEDEEEESMRVHTSGINTAPIHSAIQATTQEELLQLLNEVPGRVRCEVAPGEKANVFMRAINELVRATAPPHPIHLHALCAQAKARAEERGDR
jgi:hypothetical protein|tara:strand:- start:293 stop:604 length:312 start_codon:yes stop_codon:yes gene_type:complete